MNKLKPLQRYRAGSMVSVDSFGDLVAYADAHAREKVLVDALNKLSEACWHNGRTVGEPVADKPPLALVIETINLLDEIDAEKEKNHAA